MSSTADDPDPQHLVAELLDASRRLAALGLSPGSSGNVSVRAGSRVLVSGTGTSLADLGAEGLAEIDLAGTHLAGPRPTKEASLHLAFYRRLPVATCVIHLHSPSAVAASCLDPWSDRTALPPITPYFVMRVGEAPLLRYAPPGSPKHAERLAAIPFPVRAALLANHGQVVAGETVARAYEAAVELEAAADVMLRLPPGRFHTLTEDQALQVAQEHGSSWGGAST